MTLSPSVRGYMEENNQEVTNQVIEEAPIAEVQESAQQPVEDKQSVNWKQANMVMQQQQRKIQELEENLIKISKAQEKPEVDEFENLSPYDTITVEQAKLLAKKNEEKARKAALEVSRMEIEKYHQQVRLEQDELRMRQTHEDYDEVIEKYVTPLLNNNRALASAIQTSNNPAETAYLMGIASSSYKANKKSTPNDTKKAERILKNANRPTSSAAVGNSLKNQVDDVSKMSPQEIWKMSQQYQKLA